MKLLYHNSIVDYFCRSGFSHITQSKLPPSSKCATSKKNIFMMHLCTLRWFKTLFTFIWDRNKENQKEKTSIPFCINKSIVSWHCKGEDKRYWIYFPFDYKKAMNEMSRWLKTKKMHRSTELLHSHMLIHKFDFLLNFFSMVLSEKLCNDCLFMMKKTLMMKQASKNTVYYLLKAEHELILIDRLIDGS